ncbi:hypothetical protein K469DRAFT_704078, partial [Zopfia rhizophila CBS 207.26]
YGINGCPLTPAQARRPPALPQQLITKGRGLDPRRRLDIYRFLLLGWHHVDIADTVDVLLSEVYKIEQNLRLYGSTRKPSKPGVVLGRPRKLTPDDKQALWLIKDRGWSERALQPIFILRNKKLREAYRRCMRQFVAANLRHKAYVLIGFINRYFQDVRRGKTWVILPAYTINSYLPYTSVKEGYYSHEDFLNWIYNSLLPTLRAAVIEEASHIIRFLPPYSPDFNPIKLIFGVLKA